jgi:hypothetical protein
MTNVIYSPLVGAYHRPPAKTLLDLLPASAELSLVPQPENPYDAFAVTVSISRELLVGLPAEVRQLMADALPSQGFDWGCVLESCPVQLGFLAASEGKPLAKLRAANPEFELQGNQRVLELMAGSAAHKATLVFAASGTPIVRVEQGVAAADEQEILATDDSGDLEPFDGDEAGLELDPSTDYSVDKAMPGDD